MDVNDHLERIRSVGQPFAVMASLCYHHMVTWRSKLLHWKPRKSSITPKIRV